MSRVAVPFVLCCLAFAALVLPAAAADLRARGRHTVEADGLKCDATVIETVRFKEQICQRGVAGYGYCRWVKREHDVRLPETCTPAVTSEDVAPATRGAFPPYPHG